MSLRVPHRPAADPDRMKLALRRSSPRPLAGEGGAQRRVRVFPSEQHPHPPREARQPLPQAGEVDVRCATDDDGQGFLLVLLSRKPQTERNWLGPTRWRFGSEEDSNLSWRAEVDLQDDSGTEAG